MKNNDMRKFKMLIVIISAIIVITLATHGNVKAEEPLVLTVEWNTPNDTMFLNKMRTDNICCFYQIVTKQSNKAKSVISSISGNKLITIFGEADEAILLSYRSIAHKMRWDIEERLSQSKTKCKNESCIR